MAIAVMEKEYTEPLTINQLAQPTNATRWCLSVHECKPLFHSLAANGKSSLCVFEVPDAEALRMAAKRMDASHATRIWGATTHINPDDPLPDGPLIRDGESSLAIVQRSFDKPEVFEELQAMEEGESSCLTMHRVRFIKSFFALDRQRMACLYAAPDVEAVRKASSMTGLPYDRVMRVALPG